MIDLFPREAREHYAQGYVHGLVDVMAVDAMDEIRAMTAAALAWVNRSSGQQVRRIRERVGA